MFGKKILCYWSLQGCKGKRYAIFSPSSCLHFIAFEPNPVRLSSCMRISKTPPAKETRLGRCKASLGSLGFSGFQWGSLEFSGVQLWFSVRFKGLSEVQGVLSFQGPVQFTKDNTRMGYILLKQFQGKHGVLRATSSSSSSKVSMGS